MQLTIPFTELTDLIRKETGQAVGLAYMSADEIVVSYNASIKLPVIGPVSKEFKAGVQLLEVTNEKVVFQVEVGILNGVLDLLSSTLLKKLPVGLLESFSDGMGTLNLSAISELKPVLDRLEIDGVHLDPDNLHLDARTK